MPWKRNLGPALDGAGHCFLGAGVLPNLEGHHSHLLTAFAVAGLALMASGKFFAVLFRDPP